MPTYSSSRWGVHFVTPWDKGIPAPEILVALERLRLDRG
jgi:hypothetical protein